MLLVRVLTAHLGTEAASKLSMSHYFCLGYNGKDVFVCPRTVLAMVTQTNTVDMSRRSPSYEMRLAKYATRGFEVAVPELDRDRVDPFLYEKRFDQNKGLARLLMIERLKTPEERLRYRLKGQLKNNTSEWVIQRRIRKTAGDTRNIGRLEGCEGITPDISGPELSDYSTIFLPWGPNWPVEKLARLTKKKDAILNRIEILPNGHVIKCRRSYKIHVCAVGSMEEVIADPFPDDPPIPDDAPAESLQGTVRGKLSWLVDNPGRQQIGSFNPITEEDWVHGVYISHETEALILAANADDISTVKKLVDEGKVHIEVRDFLGRTALHVAVLSRSKETCRFLLERATVELLQARVTDGRTALHLAAMRGDFVWVRMILEARKRLAVSGSTDLPIDDILDVNGGDWESKLSPFHYAVLMGSVDTVKTLIEYGADPKKPAVHKDRNQSLSVFDLLFIFASEGDGTPQHQGKVSAIADAIFVAGASPSQVDTNGQTTWHRLANITKPSSVATFELFMSLFAKRDSKRATGLDILDNQARTPLYVAALARNAKIVTLLLQAGAVASFDQELWDAMIERQREHGNQYYLPVSLETAGKRSPIFAAASLGDKDTVEAFLAHDRSLSNAATKLLVTSTRGSRARHRQQQKFIESSVLDVLQGLKAGAENSLSAARTIETRLEDAQKRLDDSKAAAANASCNYTKLAWSVVSNQLEENLRKVQSTKTQPHDDVAEVYKKQIEMLDECVLLVKDFGGIELAGQPLTEGNGGNKPPRVAHLQLPTDPSAPFTELKTLSFRDWNSYNFYSTGPTGNSVSDTTQRLALDLMAALAENNIDSVTDLLRRVPVNIADSCCSASPLSIATYFENTDSLDIIVNAAKSQFRSHVDRKKSIEEAEKAVAMADAGEETGPVKDQLRRLNNLEIASGDVPESKRTPDMMRHHLESAAARASVQTALINQSAGKSPVRSSVKEYTMFFHRMVVIAGEREPRLVELKEQLLFSQPTAFPNDFVSKPVRMRPIELAVVRGNATLVKKLLDLFNQIISEIGPEDPRRDNVEQDDDDQARKSGKVDSEWISPYQLRYQMFGEGSRNPDLGEMSLVRLAVAAGNLEIFREIATHSREFLIPLGALSSWKFELDSSLNLPTKELEELRLEADLISGKNNYRAPSVPAWAATTDSRSYRRRCALGPTVLQFALAVGSSEIVHALLSGCLDEDMWGWLEKSGDVTGRFSFPKNAAGPFGLEETALAAAWLIGYVKTHGFDLRRIALKLSGPLAVDSMGRSSVFYAAADYLNDIATAGVSATGSKSTYLDDVIPKGYVSPLMAAASSLDVSRVELLLKNGCCTTTAAGPRRWSVVHYAIPGDSDENIQTAAEGDAKTEAWDKARKIIELVLAYTKPSDVSKVLLCPEAEHTPLMLATTRGADGRFLGSLVDLYGQYAVEGLAGRDAQLNNLLHKAVEFDVKKQRGVDEGSVEYLLKLNKKAPRVLGPNVENSKGSTPVDVALDTVAFPWLRAPNASGRRSTTLSHIKKHLSESDTSNDRFLASRQIVAAVEDSLGGRVAAGFDEVKAAKAAAAREVNLPVTKTEEGFHSEPAGRPAVFVQSPGVRAGSQIDVWRFWPTKF